MAMYSFFNSANCCSTLHSLETLKRFSLPKLPLHLRQDLLLAKRSMTTPVLLTARTLPCDWPFLRCIPKYRRWFLYLSWRHRASVLKQSCKIHGTRRLPCLAATCVMTYCSAVLRGLAGVRTALRAQSGSFGRLLVRSGDQQKMMQVWGDSLSQLARSRGWHPCQDSIFCTFVPQGLLVCRRSARLAAICVLVRGSWSQYWIGRRPGDLSDTFVGECMFDICGFVYCL